MKKYAALLLMLVIAVLMALPVSAASVSKDGYWNGIRLCGRVKVVDAFPDIKVQVVTAFPDLKVKVVDAFPDDIGKWQFVSSGEDLVQSVFLWDSDLHPNIAVN